MLEFPEQAIDVGKIYIPLALDLWLSMTEAELRAYLDRYAFEHQGGARILPGPPELIEVRWRDGLILVYPAWRWKPW